MDRANPVVPAERDRNVLSNLFVPLKARGLFLLSDQNAVVGSFTDGQSGLRRSARLIGCTHAVAR